jgi:hypothetical protein
LAAVDLAEALTYAVNNSEQNQRRAQRTDRIQPVNVGHWQSQHRVNVRQQRVNLPPHELSRQR